MREAEEKDVNDYSKSVSNLKKGNPKQPEQVCVRFSSFRFFTRGKEDVSENPFNKTGRRREWKMTASVDLMEFLNRNAKNMTRAKYVWENINMKIVT